MHKPQSILVNEMQKNPYDYAILNTKKLVVTQFLPGSGCVDTAIWMHYMDAN